MKDANNLIQALYGEGDLPENGSQESYERLAALKKQLDERPAQRPDPEVVERVVEAAGRATSSSQGRRSRSDRPARSRRSQVLRRAGVVLASLLVAVAIGWLSWPDRAGDESGEIAQNEVMPSSPEIDVPPSAAPEGAETKQGPAESEAADASASERASAPSDESASVTAESERQSETDSPEPAQAGAPAAALGDARGEAVSKERLAEKARASLPDWDLASTTYRMHRRLQQLERQVDPRGWGAPPAHLYQP